MRYLTRCSRGSSDSSLVASRVDTMLTKGRGYVAWWRHQRKEYKNLIWRRRCVQRCCQLASRFRPCSWSFITNFEFFFKFSSRGLLWLGRCCFWGKFGQIHEGNLFSYDKRKLRVGNIKHRLQSVFPDEWILKLEIKLDLRKSDELLRFTVLDVEDRASNLSQRSATVSD